MSLGALAELGDLWLATRALRSPAVQKRTWRPCEPWTGAIPSWTRVSGTACTEGRAQASCGSSGLPGRAGLQTTMPLHSIFFTFQNMLVLNRDKNLKSYSASDMQTPGVSKQKYPSWKPRQLLADTDIILVSSMAAFHCHCWYSVMTQCELIWIISDSVSKCQVFHSVQCWVSPVMQSDLELDFLTLRTACFLDCRNWMLQETSWFRCLEALGSLASEGFLSQGWQKAWTPSFTFSPLNSIFHLPDPQREPRSSEISSLGLHEGGFERPNVSDFRTVHVTELLQTCKPNSLPGKLAGK